MSRTDVSLCLIFTNADTDVQASSWTFARSLDTMYFSFFKIKLGSCVALKALVQSTEMLDG